MKTKLAQFLEKNKVVIFTFLGIGFVFFLWWIVSLIVATNYSAKLFPDPITTFVTLFHLLSVPETYVAVGGTLSRLLIGFLFSFIAGFILGLLGGLFDKVFIFFRPLITVLRTLPTASIILILVVLLPFNYTPYYVVFLVVFPIIYDALATGIRTIDQGVIDSLKLEGLYKPRSVFKVMIPISSPYILLGIVTSLGLGMKVTIMAEILSGSDLMKGIGRSIYWAQYNLEMDKVFAFSVIAILMIGIIDIGVHYCKKYFNQKGIIIR